MKRCNLAWIIFMATSVLFIFSSYAPGEVIDGLAVDASGNVGIGLTDPDSALEVDGTVIGSANGGEVSGLDGSNTAAVIGVSGGLFGNFAGWGAVTGFIKSSDPWEAAILGMAYNGAMGLQVHQISTGDIAQFIDFNDPVFTIKDGGNIGIGEVSTYGGGEGILAIGNASTNPTNTLTDAAALYVSSGEMYAYDSSGNENIISSHPSSDIETLAASDDPYPLFQKATNRVIGKEILIDKGKAFRLLQTLFPNEKFIWYRDIPKVDAVTPQRNEWKERWIEENTIESEVTKVEAFETVEVEVEDETKVIGEKVTYKLEGEEVIEIRKPAYAKTLVQKRQLREGVRFDTKTGRFFKKIIPSDAEAEMAANQEFEFKVKKWVKDRM